VTNSAASARGTFAARPDEGAQDRYPGLVVAVDGPAGSGKSSAARGAACALGLRFLDTGAMYRALTWWLLAHDIDITSPDAVIEHVLRPVIEVGTDPRAPVIRVDGTDVAGPIRERAVSNAVSVVAAVPQVRQRLIAMQREIIAGAVAEGSGIVAEGRDIGSVVVPDAPVKVFLTASQEVRALRRSADLADDPAVTAALTLRENARRDQRDAPQTARAAGAVVIDATALRLDEVIAEIVGLARGTRAGAGWAN
jgi:CMP/dCMP kinase